MPLRAAHRPPRLPGGLLTRRAPPADLLGAHVSTQGGIALAPERGRRIGASAIQLFTKSPSQWREPALKRGAAPAFASALARHGIRAVTSHDSYLINLASPDPALRRRSRRSFIAELERCETLGIPYLVSHPGNFLDDRERGLVRNAESYAAGLAAVPGRVRVLLETTAGSGTALGSSFEELAALVEAMPRAARRRIGFCADTCHLFAAGYDLAGDYDGVWDAFDRVLGLERLACLHLNDSVGGLGSRRDRHALIGEGALGPEPFRRIMTDGRLTGVIKIIETPKGEDLVTNDRRMLRRLRAYARATPRHPARPRATVLS
ncbi:MAG TPA: deoxyribonuclease IV [Gemmatimonadales bacterium]|nr:deoxyribonuclease IV [Gemmatimonadales bacterium]